MTASSLIVPDKSKFDLLNATNLLAANPANYRVALVSSSWTPAPATMDVFADVTGELATGNGYTAGGGALTSVVFTLVGSIAKFTSAPMIWTATGGSIPAWRYAVLYYLGSLNSKASPIVGYFIGDATPADMPVITVGNTLTINPVNGWVVA